jgi:hypothetical protein
MVGQTPTTFSAFSRRILNNEFCASKIKYIFSGRCLSSTDEKKVDNLYKQYSREEFQFKKDNQFDIYMRIKMSRIFIYNFSLI